jgi:predicted nucleic acid-binding protein
MKLKVYIETSVISYLTARPSRDLITAAHQQLTIDWWEDRRTDFGLYISQLVVREASAGDEKAAKRRLQAIEQIPLLELNQEVLTLARSLVEDGPLPAKASEDALHIAVATVHGMDFLLTWNCKHIANAEMRNLMGEVCRAQGYEPAITCTPEELLGE